MDHRFQPWAEMSNDLIVQLEEAGASRASWQTFALFDLVAAAGLEPATYGL